MPASWLNGVTSGKGGVQINDPSGFSYAASSRNYRGGGVGGGFAAPSAIAAGSWRAPVAAGGWRIPRQKSGWAPPGARGLSRPAQAASPQLQMLAMKLAALAVPAQGPAWQKQTQQWSPGAGWNPWTGEYRAPDVPVV